MLPDGVCVHRMQINPELLREAQGPRADAAEDADLVVPFIDGGQRPPVHHSCKLGIVRRVSYDDIMVYGKNQVCKMPLFSCKLGFLANSAGQGAGRST